jgi:ribosomal protein S27AE
VSNNRPALGERLADLAETGVIEFRPEPLDTIVKRRLKAIWTACSCPNCGEDSLQALDDFTRIWCGRCDWKTTNTRGTPFYDSELAPADDLMSVAADEAFHNWITKYEFYALGVEPLILQRGSKPLTLGHNALIRAKGYSQRWMAETSYSTTKRSLGDAVRALGWYRQFREITLMFAIST